MGEDCWIADWRHYSSDRQYPVVLCYACEVETHNLQVPQMNERRCFFSHLFLDWPSIFNKMISLDMLLYVKLRSEPKST